jgi:hypothetical protein
MVFHLSIAVCLSVCMSVCLFVFMYECLYVFMSVCHFPTCFYLIVYWNDLFYSSFLLFLFTLPFYFSFLLFLFTISFFFISSCVHEMNESFFTRERTWTMISFNACWTFDKQKKMFYLKGKQDTRPIERRQKKL